MDSVCKGDVQFEWLCRDAGGQIEQMIANTGSASPEEETKMTGSPNVKRGREQATSSRVQDTLQNWNDSDMRLTA